MKLSKLFFVFSLFSVICSVPQNSKALDKCIKLDAPILGVIDGVKGLMDGDKIHKMLYLCRELNQFMYGTLDINNKRVPQYVFKGKYYTLEQLVALEEEIESTKAKDPAQYQKDKEEIARTLEKLKEDFLSFTSKVIGDAKGAAEQTYMLIDNFMEKYGDSGLKYWRIDKDETISVHKRITNFKLCYNLSYDLYHFLKAIICAAPKAFKMYKDSQQQGSTRAK